MKPTEDGIRKAKLIGAMLGTDNWTVQELGCLVLLLSCIGVAPRSTRLAMLRWLLVPFREHGLLCKFVGDDLTQEELEWLVGSDQQSAQ